MLSSAVPRFPLIPALLILGLTTCSPPGEDAPEAGRPDAWEGLTEQVGDTLRVRTLSGSVWAGEGRLIEEAVIGTEARGEEDLLGEVLGIDATADRIFIADWVVPTVRVYDWAGNHIKNIGRHGGGPGEFYSITDLGIDGVRDELVVMETSGVTHRLTLSGEYVSRSLKVGQGGQSGSALLLRITRQGTSMVRQMFVKVDRETKRTTGIGQAFFTLDSMGVPTDTLEVPNLFHEDPWIMRPSVQSANGPERPFRPVPVPFGPVEVWTLSMDGELISGRPSEYRFQIHHGDGRVTVIERDAEPVAVKAEEKRAGERRVYGLARDMDPSWKWDGPSIPDTKPFYTAIFPDRSGRLWVLREGEGHPVEGWTEPDDWKGWRDYPEWFPEHWFEVFEEETGRYLGRVEVPEDFQVEPEPFIQGDTVIALTADEFGTPIVKRYRLVYPESGLAERAGEEGRSP